jgi:hypothetical protein
MPHDDVPFARSSAVCHSTLNMKIYFGFTVAGDRSSLAAARQMVALLEGLGHEVLTRHLVSDGAAEMDRTLGPRHIYQRDLNWLHECEMFVAEVSGSSFGLGFEAGYLLGATSKPVVLLFQTEIANRISLMITGNTHPRCTLMPYTGIAEAETRLRKVLERLAAERIASAKAETTAERP